MQVEDRRLGRVSLADATGAVRNASPRAPFRVVSLADRRRRFVLKQALVDLAAAGTDPVEQREAAAIAVLALAAAGDADGLAGILRPDPATDEVTWTVACYQIGDLTPSALRDLSDPVAAVTLAVTCPEPSHIAAELVASTGSGLRWTVIERAGEVLRLHLPTEASGSGASADEAQLSATAHLHWEDQLVSWSAEVEPTMPVVLVAEDLVAEDLVSDPSWHGGGRSEVVQTALVTEEPARGEFAHTAIAAARALAEGAGVQFDPPVFFATSAPPPEVSAPAVLVVSPRSDRDDSVGTASLAAATLAAATLRHDAEMAAAGVRHEAEMDAVRLRHVAELEAAATRHAAGLEAAAIGHGATLSLIERRLRDLELDVRRAVAPTVVLSARLSPLARRLATASSKRHPLLSRLSVLLRHWLTAPPMPTTSRRSSSTPSPIDTSCMPA